MSDIFDDIADGVASGALAASTQQADPLFDQIGADLAKADDARNNLSIKAAMASKPEVYTDHKVLAETFGVNLDFVKRNADKLKPIALQTEMSQFLKTQPKLSGWYTQGDNPAAIKFDELRHLGGLSWLWNSAGDAFASGNQDVDLSNLRYKQLMRTATDDEISLADQMSAGREPRTFGADGWLEKGWVGMAQMLPSTISTLAGGVAGGVEGAVYGGTASLIAGQLGPQVALPEELLTVPGGAAVGYRVGSLAGQIKSTFKLEAGLAYDEFKNLRDESGAVMDDDVARAAAVVAGSANALLETVSFRKAMSTIPGADAIAGTLTKDAIKAALARPTIRAALKAFAKNTLEVGATEVTTEVMQEAITLFAGEAAKGYDGDFQMATGEDVASRLGDTFTQTLQAMTIMGPLLSGSRLGHDVGRARASARDQGIIQALNDHAAGNELNARLPEKSKEAIRTLTQGGPVTHVYVDPTAITTYFQTAEEASRFAAQAGIADEFNEAVRLGRDVEIPIESYYVNMAGTEIGEALKAYTKISPDSMYAGEAEAFNDAWQAAQESLRAEYDATQATDKQALEGEERVFEDVKNKAMDAGIVPDQAQQYAKLYSAFFRVMSERTGQDAGELYARYGVDIKRAIPGGEASNFKPVDNLDLSLEMIRAGKIDPLRKRVEKASGPSLLQAIAARGGIIDTGGELKSIGADKVKGVVRAGEDNSGTLQMLDPTDAPVDLGAFNMYGADDTLRQMWEEGYFPEFADRPDTSALFDAIAEEIAGRRRFSPDYSKLDDPAIQQAAGLVAFADLLDKSGLDPSTMDNDAIRAAIDAIVNADPDTGALYQGAVENAAFLAWFGDSKVVDENGAPLVVYHGTAADFDAFDKNAEAKHIGLPGIFFTPDAGIAERFAASASRKEFRDADGYIAGYEGAATVPVYLSVQNPATIALPDRKTGVMSATADVRAALKAAQAAGHDGAIITGWADGSGDVQYVAFEPTQIKSVNNRGTFDASDPRILNQTVAGTDGGKAAPKRGSIQLAPGRTIINMFDQADLSTFLHESGHFFLEVFKDLSTMENAPAELMTDWAITKEYLGIADDNAISTEAHEKWARSFEAYLFEGKTPSVELAGIFARFRSWLMFVYKSVKALNVPMNAKITSVMDRLLASDEEIKSAMTGPEFHPQFADQKTAGMTDAQWKDYTEVAGRAVERARRELDAKLLSEVSRETTREWRAAKKEIREGVAKDMSAAPVYRVISYLRGGVDEFIPGERVYLDRKAIVDLMGEGALLKLPKGVPPIYRNNGGQHPDVLAEMFGFKSGHDMLTQMMSVPPLGRAIAAETDARMRARYGDLMADAVARARAANEAIANDATGDLLAAELEVLVRKGLVTTKATKAGAKALARQMVRGKSLREAIRVKLYMNANAKAAAEAEAAILKGDWKTAVAAKQRQLLNHYMAMEARQAEKDAESAVNYLNRFAGRKRPKGVRADELDQIDALLERFDLRKSITLKDSARRAKLAAWIAEQEAAGELPAIPDTVRDDAFRKPYRDLTVDDLMALRDSVKSIEHIGRRWAAVLGDIEAREWRGKIAEGVASIARSQELKPVRKDRNPTSWDKTVSTAKSLESTLLKLEQVFDWMDNGDIHGPMHKYVWQPIADAEARENDMRLEYSARLAKIIGDLDQARLNERITVPGVQTMSRADIMAVALNTGSESNLDKMMRGEGWDKTPAVLTNLLANLNADEARAVQAIWDTVNSFWPQIEALQKKLSGVAPPKIPARESEIAGVKLSGGYYPMMYDPERSHDVEDRAAANADRMFENTYLRPETHNGFTKERKQAYARPVLFSLDGAARHITAVIHDLTHREAILDANKFLTDASVRTEIETRYGREVYQQMVPWLQSIAHDAYKNDGLAAVERFFRGVRTRASIMGMGFRIPTMLAQLAGLSSSAEMVPIKALAGAIKDFTMSPRQMWNDANRLSGEMRFRSANMDRDVRDGVNTLGHSVTDQARRFAFYGIGFMDRIVTVPTWTAAYRDFLTREPGDEAGAVAHADKVIRLTQGAGGPKDLAAITRRNELTKLVTMFYSYFSAYYNRQRAWGRDARRAWKSGDVGEVPALVARQVFMTVMPALLGELLVGRGPDDDEGYAEWAAKRVALYPVSAVPVVRDGFNVLANGFGYSFTPAARAIDEVLIQPFKMIGDIAQGDVDPRKVVKQMIETVGYSMALPLGQLATTVDNVWKAIEDDDFQLRDIVLTRPKN